MRQDEEAGGAGPARERVEDPWARWRQVLAAREIAAKPAYEKIRRDRGRVPPEFAAVLEYVEVHLFDEDIVDAALAKTASLAEGEEVAEKHLEATLEVYVRTAQIETAVRMRLKLDYDPESLIEHRASAVGFSSLSTYRRWHNELAGFRPEVLEARNIAAESIYEQIRSDRDGVPPGLSKVLAYIEEHLFDPNLRIEGDEGALARAGIRNREVAYSISKCHLNTTLWDYVRKHQATTATRLPEILLHMYELEVPTGEIAIAVGMPKRITFSRWYKRVSGAKPRLFKKGPTLEAGFTYYTHNKMRRSKLSIDDAKMLRREFNLRSTATNLEEQLPPTQKVGAKSLKEVAAEAPVLQMLADSRRVRSDQCRSLLVAFATNFLTPMSVGSAAAHAGISDTAIETEFRFCLGETPKSYLEKRLTEAAAHLIGESKLNVPEVGRLVGLPCKETFCNIFKRKTGGECPTDLRKGLGKSLVDHEAWIRFGRGEALVSEALRVAEAIELLPPASRKTPTVIDGAALVERSLTKDKIWPELRSLPVAEAKRRVELYRFRNAPTALAELLLQKSREKGRLDRQSGIAWSRLACVSLEANLSGLPAGAYYEKSAFYHAWYANAKRLALDLSGAEEVFRKVFQDLKKCKSNSGDVATVYDLAASLRLSQRQIEAGKHFIDLSHEICRRCGDIEGQAKALKHRAEAFAYEGSPDKAVSQLREAQFIARSSQVDNVLSFQIDVNLAVALSLAEQFIKAEEALRVAKEGIEWVADDATSLNVVTWLEGNILYGLERLDSAKDKYHEAVSGFEVQADALNESRVLLDLAILLSHLGDDTEVIKITSFIVRFFDGFKLYAETVASLGLLKKSLDKSDVKGRILEEFRSALRLDTLVALQTTSSRKPRE